LEHQPLAIMSSSLKTAWFTLAVVVLFVGVISANDADAVVPEADFAEVGTGAGSGVHVPIKHEGTLRNRIHKALKVAAKALEKAHGSAEKAEAKDAVRRALADAGVADADNAGTIAWANRNLKVADIWAQDALKKDAGGLTKVASWTAGDRDKGKKMRRKCERAVQAMIAVASATKNKEMVAKEDKLRAEGKLKSYDGAIKNAREAAMYAEKSVEKARAALEATLGTKSRQAAKHALERAQEAVKDANNILKMEVGKKNIITENRLQSTGGKMVGENELHYRARKTFHKANRVLKMVEAALGEARKNHYAHKEAVMKREQKVTMEKASKLSDKERTAKSEARRKALGIKTKQEYAAYLAKEALKYGEVARDDAKKAAAAGKLAADKAAESAHVKSKLGVKNVTSTATVTEALQRETIAADLAKKAAQMEDAIVTGGKIPAIVQELIGTETGGIRDSVLKSARQGAVQQHTSLESDEDFHEFVTHRKRWIKKYKADYEDNIKDLDDKRVLPGMSDKY
jgi:hypothetical protein